MASFCTRCGTPAAEDAAFCDGCGNALNRSAVGPAAASPSSASAVAATRLPVTVGRRGLIIGGIALAVLGAGGGAAAYLLAPEGASEAAFTRAIDAFYAGRGVANDQVLCLGNLPYNPGKPIRVAEYDAVTRKWMDLLVNAGVFAPPAAEVVGSFVSQTQYVYTMSETGKKSVRNDRLCLGSKLAATEVQGFDRVNKSGSTPMAHASAKLKISDEEAWLQKSAQRETILAQSPVLQRRVELPLAIKDKKWQVVDYATERKLAGEGIGKEPMGGMLSGFKAETATSSAAASGGIMATLKKFFSFGGSNPLIGKWRDPTGVAVLEFTRDGFIDNGRTTKATYEVNGDLVTVTLENGPGGGLTFKIIDSDTVAFDMGLGSIRLSRVQ
ncbi:hypothetical protein SAMN06265795_10834 [Noviherbaspirillum humi]|uniref:Zinc-ribbon domain-containing protein n=1 Tax=Noviherbaspirillum humi TaxID=1688639 RepID=A0A239I150_9BURK|nr:zinc ribbon domain-containing protein [Noviherbaspirillum humi]SNS86773.1 hypothetical protein SAMN06265795_10834 [Noviherbaspirillum humi]